VFAIFAVAGRGNRRGPAYLPVAPGLQGAGPPVPVYNWTGFYGPARQRGDRWGGQHITVSIHFPVRVRPLCQVDAIHMDGVMACGQIGLNYQLNQSFPWSVLRSPDIQASGEKG